MKISFRNRLGAAAVAVAGLVIAGCGVDGPGVEPITGPSAPSEFALSVTLTATPDQLPRDGSSQSTVTVLVRDAQSRPVSGQRLGLGISGPTGVALSQTSVTTGSDGRATFTVTAPDASAIGSSAIVVSATPTGDNFGNAVPRTVTIALTGVANTTAPSPSFTVSPDAPQVRQVTTFDASATTDEGSPCGSACTYAWNFDDGTTGSGRVTTHAFQVGRVHTVTLTVTDATGVSAEARQVVNVSVVSAPTVTISVSPSTPAVNQQATFTATATPALGHSIQTWAWTFGDGTSQTTSSPTVSKSYSTTGNYGVSVTVTDDLGQTGNASLSVVVGSGFTFPDPVFTFSPTDPVVGQTVSFNASGVTGANGATITEYTWDFGDDSDTETNSGPTATHSFSTAQTFVVRLTVRDNTGRTDTRTREVEVDTP
jgi:PKD repeat protein